ncbi:hypothetical protein J7U46_19275 [Pelomonas sp. V22]|uniref:hypothetical protein n=1 Tax=Pelomonas sp. V22 TaxID=2822139 RepID=UPI0024A7B03C|nr:hypothetical protein [Pelomonas sp. V22]MDI4635213.1 hypothetical protein [Pelomonas sp. V22]
MKLVGFWLLVLLAVLVPATASIATSMLCPTVSVAKAQDRGLLTKAATTAAKHAVVSGSHTRVAQVKAKASKKAVPTDPQAEPCCDGTPCSQCASCGTCASIAATADLGTHVRPVAISPLPERNGPRAEFLLAGQERPPRTI